MPTWDKRSLLHLKAILHKYGINEPEIGPSNKAGNEGIQYGEFVTDLMNWKDAPAGGKLTAFVEDTSHDPHRRGGGGIQDETT